MSVTGALVLVAVVLLLRFGLSLGVMSKDEWESTPPPDAARDDSPDDYATNYTWSSRGILVLGLKVLCVAIPVSFVIEYLIL